MFHRIKGIEICIIRSKVKVILPDRWILRICEAASGRASLYYYTVSKYIIMFHIFAESMFIKQFFLNAIFSYLLNFFARQ